LAIPTTIPTLVNNLPLILFVIISWIVAFLLASKRTRRAQLFASAFGVVVMVTVLSVVEVVDNTDWVRLTLVGLWLITFTVMFLVGQRRRQHDQSIALVVVGLIVTGALVGILFGVPRFGLSSGWQRLLGFVILLLVGVAVPFLISLTGSQAGTTQGRGVGRPEG